MYNLVEHKTLHTMKLSSTQWKCTANVVAKKKKNTKAVNTTLFCYISRCL